jgi:hypothetical protein
MTSIIDTMTVSSRELGKANAIVNNPEATGKVRHDAEKVKFFWANRLRTAQMPHDALEAAFEANKAVTHYRGMAQRERAGILEVETLMSTIDPSHLGYSDMKRGNATRESNAIHFDHLSQLRILESGDLFPPRLPEPEATLQDSTVLAFPEHELALDALELLLESESELSA